MHLHKPAVGDPDLISKSVSWVEYGPACSWAVFNRCASNVGFTVGSAEIGPVSRDNFLFCVRARWPFPWAWLGAESKSSNRATSFYRDRCIQGRVGYFC
jgi:hypothetical protein